MKKKAEGGQKDLSQSPDEIELSDLMRKSLDADARSYTLLLQKVGKLMESYVANSFVRLGMHSDEGVRDVIQNVLLGIHTKRATYDTRQFFCRGCMP